MNTTEHTTQRAIRRLAGAPVPPRTGGRRTDIEAWLLDLGLRAVQVEHCPIPDCEACGPTRQRTAA